MINHRRLSLSLLALSTFALPAFAGDAQPGVFTSAQAKAGKVAYESSCGICHLNNLRGRVGDPGEPPVPAGTPDDYQKTIDGNLGYIPPLVGEAFIGKWTLKTAGEFAERIKSASGAFPPKGADDSTFLSVAAYILQANGATPGKQELTMTSPVVVRTTLATGKHAKS
jgi:mono/diheme cytochrome c family protein